MEKTPLRQHLLDHLPFHVREPETSAIIPVRQTQVVQAHQVKDRGVQVVDADAVRYRLPADLVRGSVVNARIRWTGMGPKVKIIPAPKRALLGVDPLDAFPKGKPMRQTLTIAIVGIATLAVAFAQPTKDN